MITDKRKLVSQLLQLKGDVIGSINALISIHKDNYNSIDSF